MPVQPFTVFLVCHIVTGAAGLGLFWATIFTRKGSRTHRRIGRAFLWSMLATGTFAAGMAISTIIAPAPGHHGFEDPALIRGVFGWMMLYLAALTISLAWHARMVVRNRFNHAANRAPHNVGIQLGVIAAAANSIAQGVLLDQTLMIAIAIVGLASGTTNLFYIWRRVPDRLDYQREHIKAGIGAGISVYTAFLAFGLVRLAPALALNPLVWAAPTLIGVAFILYYGLRLGRADKRQPGRLRAGAEGASVAALPGAERSSP